VTTQYVYDGMDFVQEIQGGVTTNYIRTLNIDKPLARIKADGTIRHYKSDALGSVIALADDTGVVTTTYTYDPFGNTTVSGENSDNPFQYIGNVAVSALASCISSSVINAPFPTTWSMAKPFLLNLGLKELIKEFGKYGCK